MSDSSSDNIVTSPPSNAVERTVQSLIRQAAADFLGFGQFR
jgi:hypothetical protein